MMYLASPYSDPDPAVRKQRFEAVCATTAAMLRVGMVGCPNLRPHPVVRLLRFDRLPHDPSAGMSRKHRPSRWVKVVVRLPQPDHRLLLVLVPLHKLLLCRRSGRERLGVRQVVGDQPIANVGARAFPEFEFISLLI